MRKYVPIGMVVLLLVSGFGAAASQIGQKNTQRFEQTKNSSVVFSSPLTMADHDGFISLSLDDATSELAENNRPVLPIYVRTYTLPRGSKNINVVCNPKDVGMTSLEKEIIPACIAPLSKMNEQTTYVKDSSVYGSSEVYPASWFNVRLGAGLDDNVQEGVFVTIVCYPVRYSPANNLIYTASGFDIQMTYDAPIQPAVTRDTYDMVIIAPASFESALQRLIDHKISKGIQTTFKSVEDIFDEYEGTDPPEQVKMCIKDAYDTGGITYVLLVGGLKSHLRAKDKDAQSYGSKAWWVPVRYLAIRNDNEVGCISDLYYADLYDASENFCSWDADGDGIYGEWTQTNIDGLDLYPDVFVGRLPCTTKSEVKIVVDKIIAYESTSPAQKDWYKTMIGIGGKSFANYEGQPDGEYLCDLALEYMSSIIDDPIRVYSTNRDTGGLCPVPDDITRTITDGAGFVIFEGHGNPVVWDTIWFDGEYDNHDWAGGLRLSQFSDIKNKEKLPVVIVGGCHNGLYNVSMIPSMRSGSFIIWGFKHKNMSILFNLTRWMLLPNTSYWTHGVPAPVCFSWGLVVKKNGGAIASTGCTGYGMGRTGDPVTLSAELEVNFFWETGMNNAQNLGDAHGTAIGKFLSENTIGRTEAFCITEWQLFGDPSLKFGGYSS